MTINFTQFTTKILTREQMAEAGRWLNGGQERGEELSAETKAALKPADMKFTFDTPEDFTKIDALLDKAGIAYEKDGNVVLFPASNENWKKLVGTAQETFKGTFHTTILNQLGDIMNDPAKFAKSEHEFNVKYDVDPRHPTEKAAVDAATKLFIPKDQLARSAEVASPTVSQHTPAAAPAPAAHEPSFFERCTNAANWAMEKMGQAALFVADHMPHSKPSAGEIHISGNPDKVEVMKLDIKHAYDGVKFDTTKLAPKKFDQVIFDRMETPREQLQAQSSSLKAHSQEVAAAEEKAECMESKLGDKVRSAVAHIGANLLTAGGHHEYHGKNREEILKEHDVKDNFRHSLGSLGDIGKDVLSAGKDVLDGVTKNRGGGGRRP